MKTRLGMVLRAFALMMCAGCTIMPPEWVGYQNEIVGRLNRREKGRTYVTCVEQASISTNHALNVRNVYVMSFPFVQAYRIEGRKVFDCRWTDRMDDWDWRAGGIISSKWMTLLEVSRKLPNRLGQNDQLAQPLESCSAVTVTEMGCEPSDLLSGSEFGTWGAWGGRQWAGTSNEAPAAIEAFCQTVEQALSVPECVKNYHSYVRAVPLFTDADYDAEKDTPLIKLSDTRYHANCAIRHPYVLIPVPEGWSPLPAVRGYTSGDKFKVRDGTCYLLIETFSGNKGVGNKE